MPEKLDVIAFAPHPDDAEASCGGLLVKLVRHGYRAAICDLTRGELASNGSIEEREAEARRAAEVLGLHERINLQFPDGGLRRGNRDQLEALVVLLRERSARLIVAPHEASRHPDHLEAGELLRRAQFFCGVKRFVPHVACVQRPVLIRALDFHPMQPSFVVDITDELDVKLRGLRCHRSQFERRPGDAPTLLNDPAYLRRIETNARTYGQLIGRAAGEPYAVEGGVPLDDPVAVLAPSREGVWP
ncbi:MAG: bacillithiol biosynthesis deacetylase BshB1 [Candidatus Krumholzibacteriia bacterium]